MENKLKKANKEIYLDKLTGLNNRKLLDYLQNEFQLNKMDYTVVYIDLNDFKPINDTYGHDVGDEVLIYFSHKLKSIIRETDFIIRMGGDEFLVVLPKTITTEAISKFCRRLHEIQLVPVTIGQITMDIKFSYGFAKSIDTEGNFSKVIEQADRKMYESKHASKNKQ